MIIFGEQRYGKVDQVPGLFYVATRFIHVQFVPLLPLGSYVILDGKFRDGGQSEIKIGLSVKSILFAWFRAALWAIAVVIAIWAVISGMDATKGRKPWLNCFVYGAVASATFGAIWASYRLTRAGPFR
ncbi:MAG TPA: hypothetical protein VKI65_07380, partial [Gemmataceae bacterium]|nr:hypothetical protein [Gemmataceae bacterium]